MFAELLDLFVISMAFVLMSTNKGKWVVGAFLLFARQINATRLNEFQKKSAQRHSTNFVLEVFYFAVFFIWKIGLASLVSKQGIFTYKFMPYFSYSYYNYNFSRLFNIKTPF